MDRYATFSGVVLELSRCIQKIRELEMKPLGLRASHVAALHFLRKNPEGMTVSELTEACREDKAAVSRCLSQLTERGYVSSDPARAGRKYRTKLFLTESGREVSQAVSEKIEAAVTGGGAGLTPKQREILYSSLDRILKNLSDYLEEKEND